MRARDLVAFRGATSCQRQRGVRYLRARPSLLDHRAGSFRGSRARVLRGHGGNTVLMQFREELGAAPKKSGFGWDRSNLHPHITLLYDERSIREEAVGPVTWVVNEIVLVCSFCRG